MYGIWSIKSKSKNTTLLRNTPTTPRACNTCRTKKIKCSGQLSGCARCEDLSLKCVYTVQKEHTRRRRGQSISHSSALQQAAQSSKSDQLPRHPEVLSPPTSLGDTAFKEDAAPSDSINTTEIPSPALDNAEARPASFNDDDARATEVFPAIESSDTYPDTDKKDMNETPLPRNSCDFTSTSQLELSNPPLDFDEFFLLSPAASELDFPTPCSNTTAAPAYDYRSLIETGLFSPPAEYEQALYQPPALDSCFPPIAGELGIENLKNLKNAADPKACACLKTAILLINELESRTAFSEILEPRDLGSALVEHKEAVRHGESLVQCGACSDLSENRIMQGLLVDRLVLFCEKIVMAYLTAVNCQPPSWQKGVFLGDFKVDTGMEWDLLFGSLVALQLQSLASLIERIKGTEGSSLGRKLTNSKTKIQHLRQLLALRLPSGILSDVN
ncbi:hypothetical protein GGR50DRAFT_440122 [Xylaria sp. CBS 124048]|nr:hypothetical protein GGR50DRAFT_440122 [Xylaria sp. CBS 124048]